MKYKLSIQFEFITEEQENYDELINDGYSPEEAKNIIKDELYELANRLNCRADNIFWNNYTEIINVEKIND